MTDWGVRLRAILDKQFTVIIPMLVVLAVLGTWVTYATYVSPGTTTVERPGSSWEMTAQYNHAATVTKENPLYPVGSELTERTVYFTQISPTLNGSFSLTYDASNSGNLEETIALSLIIRGVEQERREENKTVIWQTSRQLNKTTVSSLNSGETVRVPFSLNMSDIDNQTHQINQKLGGAPGQTEVLLRASVHHRGTINGQSIDQQKTYVLPIAPSSNTYRIRDPGALTERHESTQTVVVEETYGPVRRAGGPLLLLLSLAGLGAIGYSHYQGRLGLSDAEREHLAYEDDRNDFDEWINTIHLPEDAFEYPKAEADSLGALVDFAIDTNNSVIEDPDENAYYVVHDGYLYTYQPPSTPSDWNMLGFNMETDAADSSEQIPNESVASEPSSDPNSTNSINR